MKAHLAIAAAAALGASAPALADSYRLAFSKAENIEIFVEHAPGTPWCSRKLALRAVHGGEPDVQALAGLLPKLGALLDRQCPQAAQIEWASMTAGGERFASGTSAKSDRWALREATAQPALAAVPAPVPTPTPPTSRAAIPAPAPPTSAASVPTPSPGPAPAPKVAAPTPPAEPPSPRPGQAASASSGAAPAAAAAPALTPPASPTPQAVATPPPVTEPPNVAASSSAAASGAGAVVAPGDAGPAPAARTSFTSGASSVSSAATAVIGDFEVNGWKPLGPEAARKQAGFLKEMEDQNGCRILTSFAAAQDSQFVTLKSDGLECGADGYASGRGRLLLERSDGALVARTGALWFAGGIPFNQELGVARLAASDARRTLWFFLVSDSDTKTHYLLRAQPANQSGIGFWLIEPRVDAITADEARFRQAEPIRVAVEAGLAALEHATMPKASRTRMVFASDFAKGTAAGSADHLVYEIAASRYLGRRRTDAAPAWRYNLQGGTNHLFRRDARLAQQRQLEAQREAQRERAARIQQANAERRNVQTYQRFVEEAKQNPKQLLARLESDVGYEPGSGGGYAALVSGGKKAISRIVRVSGSDGEDAEVDFPYEMRLVGQRELKKGWYRAKGTVTLDPGRRDGDDLPLTLLTPDSGAVHGCAKDGCSDLADPLTLTRLTLGIPGWTPEAAASVIEAAGRP